MDAADATTLGAWASIRGYFTPATLFLVLNLVIGTIALTSRSRDQRRRRHEHLHHEYAHHPQAHHHYQEPLHDPYHQQQQEYHDYYQQQPHQYATPPPPARTSSVLDRLRSIGLYRFRSGDFSPEYATTASTHHDAFAPVEEEDAAAAAKQYARSRSEPAPAAREQQAPPRATKKSGAGVIRKARVVVEEGDEAVRDARAEEEFVGRNLTMTRHEQREPASPPRRAEQHIPYYRGEEEEEVEHAPPPAPMRAPPPLSRTSSVLDRLRSQLGLYSFLAADQPPAAATPAAPKPDAFAAATPVSDKKHQATAKNAHYDRSRSEPAAREQAGKSREKKQQAAPAPEARMAKSTSSSTTATRKPAGPSLVSQQSVNTRAEAFIDSFRKGQSQSQKQQQQQQLHHHDEDDDHHHVAVPPPPAPLARTSSVLDRLRSFSLYLRSGDQVVDEPPVNNNDKAVASAAADEKANKQAAQYSRSRSEPGKKKAPQAKMSKTSSEVHIAEETAAAPAEECVDARADDFINKFRQQLQLQRLNSLLSYGKQQ